MPLSPDLGGKVSLQAGEFLDEGGIGIHELAGDGVEDGDFPRHHWRNA